MTTTTQSVGCVIVTLHAEKHLPHCLPPLLNSPLKPRVLIIDSSSSDNTVGLAREMGAETLVIPRAEFNHGTTREKARLYLGTDIVSMHTQDAYIQENQALSALIAPIVNGVAAAAYARQIPHLGASFFEGFAREFNYPATSHIRSLDDLAKYGIYTFFCSDSCAAYSNKALDEVGGFSRVLLGEDTVAVAKLLRKGHRIAYVAEAVARHSHHYSLREEFRRNFDTGLARKDYEELLKCPNGIVSVNDKARGIAFAKTMLSRLSKEAPGQLPYAAAHILAKWLGYKVGRSSTGAPLWFKRWMSSQPYFFD